MFKISLFLLAVIISAFSAYAETVKVGFEPFPPLIVDENNGYTIKLLKAIEKSTDLKFTITIMPYNRAKKELSEGSIDLIGHTPYQQEAKEFYNYAQETIFTIDSQTDLYVIDENKLKDISKLKIGIPRGNEDFASEVLGVPKENFYLGAIDNLLPMLKAGRIDAFWFERASTMETIKKLKLTNIFYMALPSTPIAAGLAVKKDAKGTALKTKLDKALSDVDYKKILKDYNTYLKLPAKGIVK